MSRYSDFELPYGEPIHPCAKDASFTSMCDFPDKYMKFLKRSRVLNFCSECPGVFVTDAEISCEEYVNLPFICFHPCKNITSCYLHAQILPDNGKTCPLCMNLEKEKITTQKSHVLKSCRILDFHL